MFQPYHLSRGTRITIMLVLITSFFVISPALILYTAGYRYDRETGTVQTTGVLSIDVEPDDATVSINDVQIQENLPIVPRIIRFFQGKSLKNQTVLPLRLPDLTPGVYHVHIEKDGYQSWTKDITVESNKTAYIKDIQLFKEAEPTLLFETEGMVYLSQSGNYFLQENDATVSLAAVNRPDAVLFSTQSEETPIRISWSPFGDHFAVETEMNNKRFLYLVSAEAPETPSRYAITGTNDDIRSQWLNTTAPSFIMPDRGKLQRYTFVGNAAIAPITSQNWFVDENEDVWTVKENTTIVPPSSEEAPYQLGSRIRAVSIIDVNKHRIVISDGLEFVSIPRGDATLASATTIPADKHIYNDQTDELIAWSPWELWLISPDRGAELRNRTSAAIKKVLPLDTEGVLLIATDESLLAFNPNPLYYTTHELFQGTPIELVSVDIENRQIYLFATLDGVRGLYQLEY